MRVNVYAEEMTERVEIIAKEIDGQKFTGLRLYLELPATETLHTVGNHEHVEETTTRQVRGPFMHRPGDDDSAAVTFWGKRDLRGVLRLMLTKLDEHYGNRSPMSLCNVFAEIKEGHVHTSGWCCLSFGHKGGHQYRIGNGS
jgi:hypothetical protein